MCKIARNRLPKCVNFSKKRLGKCVRLHYRNRCYGNVHYDKTCVYEIFIFLILMSRNAFCYDILVHIESHSI